MLYCVNQIAYRARLSSVSAFSRWYFTSTISIGRNLAIVNANREVARSNGVSGTPTFFLNDQTLSGAQPLDVFAQTINSLMAAQ